MLLLGWFYPRKTKWELVDSQEVDLTPWKAAWPLAIALVVTVLSLYVFFAK
jgi:SSS family solute:Na+ symporter